jgi:hypothetical protein
MEAIDLNKFKELFPEVVIVTATQPQRESTNFFNPPILRHNEYDIVIVDYFNLIKPNDYEQQSNYSRMG